MNSDASDYESLVVAYSLQDGSKLGSPKPTSFYRTVLMGFSLQKRNVQYGTIYEDMLHIIVLLLVSLATLSIAQVTQCRILE
jgi:hypothetical protein